MSVRKSSVVWAVLGVVLIVGAVIIRFLVLPAMTKLPDDLSQSQRYDGTMRALNSQAFAAGDFANLLTPQMPIVADRSLTVDAVDGDTAIVTRNSVVTLPDSSTQDDIHTYAVDRVDYSPVGLDDEQKNALVPVDKQATFEAHSGLTFSWPMDPAAQDTQLYDPVTRTAQTATFVDEDEVQGRKVYNYRVDAAGPIGNPTLLAGFEDFPAQLPKAMIEGLLQAGVVPEKSRETLTAALPSLPDLVGIGFGSTNEVSAAVDAEFGAPLQVEQTQAMYVTVSADGRDIPTLPLSVVSIHTAENEVVSSADTLSKNSTMLSILGLWLPLALGLIGIALVALGIVRRRTV